MNDDSIIIKKRFDEDFLGCIKITPDLENKTWIIERENSSGKWEYFGDVPALNLHWGEIENLGHKNA